MAEHTGLVIAIKKEEGGEDEAQNLPTNNMELGAPIITKHVEPVTAIKKEEIEEDAQNLPTNMELDAPHTTLIAVKKEEKEEMKANDCCSTNMELLGVGEPNNNTKTLLELPNATSTSTNPVTTVATTAKTATIYNKHNSLWRKIGLKRLSNAKGLKRRSPPLLLSSTDYFMERLRRTPYERQCLRKRLSFWINRFNFIQCPTCRKRYSTLDFENHYCLFKIDDGACAWCGEKVWSTSNLPKWFRALHVEKCVQNFLAAALKAAAEVGDDEEEREKEKEKEKEQDKDKDEEECAASCSHHTDAPLDLRVNRAGSSSSPSTSIDETQYLILHEVKDMLLQVLQKLDSLHY